MSVHHGICIGSSPTKMAYSAEDIFEQQRDPARHDIALQLILLKLRAALEIMFDVAIPKITDMRFAINFSNMGRERKRLSIKVREPVLAMIEMFEEVSADLEAYWLFTSGNKQVRFVFGDTGERVHITETDDTPDHARRRVIVLPRYEA